MLIKSYLEVIYNSITAEYVLWINYLAPALSPLISYPDVSTVAEADLGADAVADADDDTLVDPDLSPLISLP